MIFFIFSVLLTTISFIHFIKSNRYTVILSVIAISSLTFALIFQNIMLANFVSNKDWSGLMDISASLMLINITVAITIVIINVFLILRSSLRSSLRSRK